MSFLPGKEGGAAHGVPVYRASDFVVANGANLGDPISHADEVMLDDIYRLSPGARRWRLALSAEEGLSHLTVTTGAQTGCIGAPVHLDSCATLMAPDGTILEALVLVELEPGSDLIAATYLLPLADVRAKTDYALVSVDRDTARHRFAAMACVSFLRGTLITTASGQQRPVEELRVGDEVLTRDNGIQPVRWIGHQTYRATGAFAPILIQEGAMNNARDLWLSPNQRLFIYQREDRLGAGRAEVMVKAELLVNGDTVRRGEGGFVDYYQVLFDNHEFIYAEGIATESLTIDARTTPALPKELQDRLGLPRGRQRRRSADAAVDLAEGAIDSAIAADVLRRASSL